MLLAFCVMQPIEKQINPLASMPIDSIFSFGVPLICRCPAMSKADSEAIKGRAAQLHFIGSSVDVPSCYLVHVFECKCLWFNLFFRDQCCSLAVRQKIQ